MSSDTPTGSPEPPDERGRSSGPGPEPRDERGAGRQAQSDAWGAFGLLLSGVAVWGGVGGLVSHWTHQAVFTMVGLLVGMGTALYGIWFRYGRS
jgi:ATP synthase protein I